MTAMDEVPNKANCVAAIPAGPAPRITTSNRETSAIAHDPHSRRDRHEARALMRALIDRHATLLADPHAAERGARGAGHRCANRQSRVHERRGNRDATGHNDGDAVDGDLEQVGTHAAIFRMGPNGAGSTGELA